MSLPSNQRESRPVSTAERRGWGWVLGVGVGVCCLSTQPVYSDTFSGLWVGQVNVSHVNEVSIPLDENNIAIAPDPNVPTPTADLAQIRLILHVNGAGQVSLLKDVALLDRIATNGLSSAPGLVDLQLDQVVDPTIRLRAESDMALVTDERLYGTFPPQPAMRIASTVFDFGDSRATQAVTNMIEAAAIAAAISVTGSVQNFGTSTGRVAAIAAALTAAQNAALPIAQSANVSDAFVAFMTDVFDSGVVDNLAIQANPDQFAGTVGNRNSLRGKAELVRVSSFYNDTRPLDMVNAVVQAAQGAGTNVVNRQQAAQNAAASFADVSDTYHRYIAGKIFGDALLDAVSTAATQVAVTNATEQTIRDAVQGQPAVVAARAEALAVKVTRYNDNRAPVAVEQVLDSIVAAAVAFLPPAIPPTGGRFGSGD